MELDPQEKSVLDKRNVAGDHFNYHHQSVVPSEWRFSGNLTNGPTSLVCTERSMKGSGIENPPCSSVSMVNSFGQPSIWNSSHDPLINNEESMNCSTGYDLGWNPSSSGGTLPQSLVQFPADPAFIERAARFSSFSSGNFADIVNPFMVSESLLPYVKTGVGSLPQGPELLAGDMVQKNDMDVPRSGDASPVNLGIEQKIESMMRSSSSGSLEEGKERVGQLRNEVDLADGGDSGQGEIRNADNAANEPVVKVATAKRRRRGSQIDPNQVNPSQEATEAGNVTPDVKLKGEENQNAGSRKSSAKQSKENSQNSDSPKEDYIHIRARRGQATNSHSLAERVRREKISERMKFLQDLVPGCSKVTGKAVMLDEIINYVQSLQRQVEFLSMKLATVNPRLDFSLDQLLAKEMLQPLNVPSLSVGFTPDISMTHPSLVHDHHQQSMVESNMQNLLHPSDQLRRMLSSHFTSGGYKEPAPQMLNVWNEEFQNAAQLPFVNSTSLQPPEESNSSLPHGHLKPEH